MEGRLTPNIGLTKPGLSSRLDAGVLNGHVRTINRDLDILDAAIGALGGGGGGSMTNPMTSPEDLIKGGTAGAPTRLGKGAEGQHLAVVGGVLTWQTPPPPGIDVPTADARYVRFAGGSVMTGALAPESDFGADLGTALRRFDTFHASAVRLRTDLGVTAANTGSPNPVFVAVAGEAQSRLQIAPDGTVRWGSGAAAQDASLGRTGPATLTLTGSQAVTGALSVAAKAVAASPDAGNALTWNANGFYAPAGAGGPPTGAAGGDLTGTYPNPQIAAGVITDADVAAANKDGAAATAGLRTLGTGASQAAAGDHAHAAAAAENQLTNPSYEVWARGNGPFTANNAHTADRWQIQLGTGTVSVTRESALVDTGSAYALAAVVSGGGTGAALVQVLEHWAQLRGRTVTFAVRVRSSVAGVAKAGVFTGTGWTEGTANAGTGAYETLTVTAAVPTGATSLWVRVNVAGSATVYLDNAVLVVGSSAPAFVPLHPQEDLARCQRYYVEVGGLANYELVAPAAVHSATTGVVVLRFPVEMALTPTVVVSSPAHWACYSNNGTVVPLTALAVTVAQARSAGFSFTVASGLVAGNASQLLSNNTTAARITFTANP